MVSLKQGFKIHSNQMVALECNHIFLIAPERHGFLKSIRVSPEKCEKARYSIANSFHPRWDIIGSIIKKKGDIKYAFFPIPEHNYLGFDDIPANLSELKRVRRTWTLVSADKHDDKWHF